MGHEHDAGGKRSDEELLAAWRAGDTRAGAELWRRHARSVQRFFRNKVPWSVALDLSQRTAEAVLKSRQEIRSFRPYVLGVAVRQLQDYLRGEARKQRRQPDLETLTIDQTVGSPEEWVGAKREKRVLLLALRRLPLPQQLVFELRYWEQLSDRDIAEVLGWPAGTVKTRLNAGKRSLRAEMKRLSESPDGLRSTMDSLEQWAHRTHDRASREVRGREQTPGGIDLAQGSGAIGLPLDGIPFAIDDSEPS